MIVVTLLLGTGVGLGVLLLARGLMPKPEPLAAAIGGLTPRAGSSASSAIEAAAERLLRSVGVSLGRRAEALRLVDRTPARHALDKLVGLLGGAAGALLVGVGLQLVGAGLPPAFVAFSVLGCAAGGFVLPDVSVAETAAKRRRAFRHALSAYLDLVNVILAGGGGIESALFAAADAGDGWAFAELRRTLDRARFTGRSPWELFAELGAELDVPELAELAASVSLAGSHGARIRQSLAAKADTLRGHQVAETEAAAEAATERMTIPVAVLLFGFLVFIAYPAVVQITTVSSSHP